jgi:hypothetical protein
VGLPVCVVPYVTAPLPQTPCQRGAFHSRGARGVAAAFQTANYRSMPVNSETAKYPLSSYLRRANLHAPKPGRMFVFIWERKLYQWYLQSRACHEPHRYVASRHPPPSGKLDCFCKKRNEIETKPKQRAPLMCAGWPAGGSGGCGFLCR